jgi:predicted secreted protein
VPESARRVTVTELDAGGSVELELGDMLEFDLYENPATGFRWHLEVEQGELLHAVENDFQIYSTAVGGGGRAHLRLASLAVGTTLVHAVSARRWQRDAIGGQRLSVIVRINPRSN